MCKEMFLQEKQHTVSTPINKTVFYDMYIFWRVHGVTPITNDIHCESQYVHYTREYIYIYVTK